MEDLELVMLDSRELKCMYAFYGWLFIILCCFCLIDYEHTCARETERVVVLVEYEWVDGY